MSSIDEKIIINEMNKPELIGNIIDIFEDFLDDKGIIIPNPERDEDPELATGVFFSTISHILSELK